MEGWNPGIHDAEVFYATEPDGFYGFFNQGELVAGSSMVSYSGDFGFMGFFIVKPEFRSKGIGHKLWHLRRDTLLGRLKPGARQLVWMEWWQCRIFIKEEVLKLLSVMNAMKKPG